jgi:hypothetical protein
MVSDNPFVKLIAPEAGAAAEGIPSIKPEPKEKKWRPCKDTPSVFVYAGIRIETADLSEDNIARLIAEYPDINRFFEKI